MTDLQKLRDQIDIADANFIAALAERFAIVEQIKTYKKKNGVAALDQSRYDQMILDRKKIAQEQGLSPMLIEAIFTTIHDNSLKQQL